MAASAGNDVMLDAEVESAVQSLRSLGVAAVGQSKPISGDATSHVATQAPSGSQTASTSSVFVTEVGSGERLRSDDVGTTASSGTGSAAVAGKGAPASGPAWTDQRAILERLNVRAHADLATVGQKKGGGWSFVGGLL